MIAAPRHARTLQSCHPRAATIAWLMLVVCGTTLQAQTCPDTAVTGTERPGVTSKPIDYSTIPAQFSFDSGNSILNGESQLYGAKITQGERFITADVLHYDFATKKIKADGNVAYEDTQLRVTGNDANMDTNAGVEFERASFALKTRAGHGSAERIQLAPQGNLHLGEVHYTTCPLNKPDWELKLSSLDINQATRTGTGRNVRLEFKSIPIIVVTSYALSGDEGKAREAGCDAYVTKPYSPRALLAKIREYLPK